MSGHTPGPWAVCTNPANESWWAGTTIGTDHEDERYSRRICDLAVISPDKEANGRLIAAAPDLLRFLSLIRREYLSELIEQDRDALLDLISRAEGTPDTGAQG